MPQDQYDEALAREDLCRFLAACYYEPGPEFAEEKLFGSMLSAAQRIDPELASIARRLGEDFAASDTTQLLLDYTRLFLGPFEILAKPYGSVWLEGDRRLMGDSTVAVQELYGQAGFELSEEFRELPDHIAAELEFLYLLVFRANEARRKAAPDALAEASRLRNLFLQRHLGRWIAPFAAAVKAGAQSAFYRDLAELTERFVKRESEQDNAR